MRRIASDYGEFNVVIVDVPGADTEQLAQRLAALCGGVLVSRTAADAESTDASELTRCANTMLAAACRGDAEQLALALAARANQDLRTYAAQPRAPRKLRVFAHSHVEDAHVMHSFMGRYCGRPPSGSVAPAAAVSVAQRLYDADAAYNRATSADQPTESRTSRRASGSSGLQGGQGGMLPPSRRLRDLQSLYNSVQSVAQRHIEQRLTLWVYVRHTEAAWAALLDTQPEASRPALGRIRELLDEELHGPSKTGGQAKPGFFQCHHSACIDASTPLVSGDTTVANIADLLDRHAAWLHEQGLLLQAEWAQLSRSILSEPYQERRRLVCTRDDLRATAESTAPAAAASQ